MNKLHVRKNDTVVVVSGQDKGKVGKVKYALPAKDKVVVEGVNVRIKHVKPKGAGKQGGRLKQELPIFSSKVMLYCGKCNKATRIAHKFLQDGSKVRVCKKCGNTFDK